jgi:hypothetical protein
MPAVQAIKVLEALDDDPPSANIRQTPGLIIHIEAPTQAKPVTIEVSPASHVVPSDEADDAE